MEFTIKLLQDGQVDCGAAERRVVTRYSIQPNPTSGRPWIWGFAEALEAYCPATTSLFAKHGAIAPPAQNYGVPTTYASCFPIGWRIDYRAPDLAIGEVSWSSSSMYGVLWRDYPNIVTLQTDRDSAGTLLPTDAYGNQTFIDVPLPCRTFRASRTELASEWGAGSASSPTSQRYKSDALMAKLNSAAFLDKNTKFWLYMGAQVELLPDRVYVRVEYEFSGRQWDYGATNQKWQYRASDGTLYDIHKTGNFGDLALYWEDGTTPMAS